MKRTPILIMCLGGQGASVLSRSFHVCGMQLGNENTFWLPNFLFPHGEHSYVTSIMGQINIPESDWQTKLREVLQSYRKEADKEDWKIYGIKTTSGICNYKWDAGVSAILKEEWPDALYFGVIRNVNPYNPFANDGWNAVWEGRKGMVERGGIFVPFPEAWQNETIKEIIETIGLTWNDEVNNIFVEPFEEKETPIISQEDIDAYFKEYPLEKEQREYLTRISKENLNRLKWHKNRPSKFPMDYCVIVINKVKSFVKLQFESLINPAPSLNIIGGESFDSFESFHIIDKYTKDGVIDYCQKAIPNVHIHKLGQYLPINRTNTEQQSGWQWDLAYSFQHAIENCGTSDWIFISHPDVVYWNSILYFEGLWGLTAPDVGLVWDGGCFLVRREAYQQSHFGLWPLFGGVCLEEGMFVHEFDEKAIGKKYTKVTLEAAELFVTEIQMLGWRSVRIPFEISKYKEHTAGSTGHDICLDNPALKELWSRKMKLVNKRLEHYEKEEVEEK